MQSEASIFDSGNFSAFFAENNQRLVQIACSYVRDIDAAKDIVMDSFAYIWSRRQELEGESNMLGYLYLCVRSRCLKYLRHQSARRHVSEPAQQLVKSALESLSRNEIYERLFSDEIMDILNAELSKMPSRTRKIFLASRNEHLTYAEIAERYSISVRRVTSEIQTALQTLREALDGYLPAVVICLLLQTASADTPVMPDSHPTQHDKTLCDRTGTS